MATALDIAKAVADDLTFAADTEDTFGQAITFEWSLIPEVQIAQLTQAVAHVVPLTVEETNLSRSKVSREFEISVGIRKKIAETNGKPDQTQMLGMATLVDAVSRYLRHRELTDLPGVKWIGGGIDPVYVPDELRENGVYMGLVRVRYAVHE